MQRFVFDIQNLALLHGSNMNGGFFADVVINHAASFQSTSRCSKTKQSPKQVPFITHGGLHVRPPPKHTIQVFSENEIAIVK